MISPTINKKRIWLVLLGLVMVGALVPAFILVWNATEAIRSPYYRAALAIEAEYGDYTDVTYIGQGTSWGKTLTYMYIVKEPFSEEATDGHEALVLEKLRGLLKRETHVFFWVLQVAPDGIPRTTIVLALNAERVKAGASIADSVDYILPLEGSAVKKEYLRWRDE